MSPRHPVRAIRLRIAIAGILALLVVLLPAARAFGDADPASDVLLGANVFYPYSPPVSPGAQARLNAEVASAHRSRFPLKVALVATPIDLGALPTFFGKPQQYASFLDQEISFVNFGNQKAPLLVVMPDGYGAAGLPASATAVLASLAKPGRSAEGLARAAIAAVPRLAVASGHRLAISPPGSAAAGGTSPVLLVIVLAAVCILLAAGILAWRRRPGSARRPQP